MRRWLTLLLMIMVVLALPVIAQDTSETAPPRLVPKVINSFPHDISLFTEGLIFYDGKLYESAGLDSKSTSSTLSEIDPTTGEILRQVPLSRPEADLAAGKKDYFGEGLERVGDQLIQLTWTEGQAFVYDINTFEIAKTFTYEGEGWGLCSDGKYLYMGDSTNYLSLRDPETFDLIVRFLVTYNGSPIQGNLINELECVDDSIYANMWQTNLLVKIDKMDGTITALIDASDLLTKDEQSKLDSGQVLNGIAYNPETKTFFITGKQWPKIFEVEFVPAPPEK